MIMRNHKAFKYWAPSIIYYSQFNSGIMTKSMAKSRNRTELRPNSAMKFLLLCRELAITVTDQVKKELRTCIKDSSSANISLIGSNSAVR